MAPGGLVVTIDFRKVPSTRGPPLKDRVSLANARQLFSRQPFRVTSFRVVFRDQYYVKARVDPPGARETG